MNVFVKICGLCTEEDVDGVAALKPDAMGFVFWRKSKRAVSIERAAEWSRGVPKGIAKVGVFVDASIAEIARAIRQVKLDIVQLHGHEPPELVELLPTKVWRVWRPGRESGELPDAYPVDAFLVDSYSSAAPGGTGQLADWDEARAFVKSVKTPVVLAGGLKSDNVREAVKKVRPWGVDVSSGVEVRPGKKDLELVREFIKQCRKR